MDEGASTSSQELPKGKRSRRDVRCCEAMFCNSKATMHWFPHSNATQANKWTAWVGIKVSIYYHF